MVLNLEMGYLNKSNKIFCDKHYVSASELKQLHGMKLLGWRQKSVIVATSHKMQTIILNTYYKFSPLLKCSSTIPIP